MMNETDEADAQNHDRYPKKSTAMSIGSFIEFRFKANRKTLKDVFIDYCRITSAHGVSHATSAPTKGWRWFWIVVTSVCLCIMTYQIAEVFIEYLAFDTTVSIELEFKEAPFPAVTICNLNPYKRSLVMQHPLLAPTLTIFTQAMTAVDGKPLRRKRSITEEERTLKPFRYRPMLASCMCEVDKITGLQKSTNDNCLPSYKGTTTADLTLTARSYSTAYRSAYCICEFDTATNTSWPCFSYGTWEELSCTGCVEGRCPIFDRANQPKEKALESETFQCYCHEGYNLCVGLQHGDKMKAKLSATFSEDVSDYLMMKETKPTDNVTTTTTTEAPAEVLEAQGYQGVKDEVAIAVKGRENMLFAAQELSMEELTALSYTINETIIRCSFDGKECDLEKDFKRHLDASYGNCFTFNYEPESKRIATRAGAHHGLRMLVNVNVADYLPTTEATGVRVTLHDQTQVPFPNAFGYSAPTGFLSSFGVKMKTIERLPDPYGVCRETTTQDKSYIYYPFEYSVEGCHRDCFQHKVITHCGCGDPTYPVPMGNRTCSVNDPVAKYGETLGKCLDEQILNRNSSAHDCHCPEECLGKTYDGTFSTAEWPSGRSKLPGCSYGDSSCINEYKENAVMIQVFYQELNFELLRESPAYPFVQVLADLGGLVGLWLGLSLISMLEVAVLFYNLFKWMTQDYISKRERQKRAMILKMAETGTSFRNAHAKPNWDESTNAVSSSHLSEENSSPSEDYAVIETLPRRLNHQTSNNRAMGLSSSQGDVDERAKLMTDDMDDESYPSRPQTANPEMNSVPF